MTGRLRPKALPWRSPDGSMGRRRSVAGSTSVTASGGRRSSETSDAANPVTTTPPATRRRGRRGRISSSDPRGCGTGMLHAMTLRQPLRRNRGNRTKPRCSRGCATGHSRGTFRQGAGASTGRCFECSLPHRFQGLPRILGSPRQRPGLSTGNKIR